MIKDGILVDTSVFIDFLKGEERYIKIVAELLEKKLAVTTGIIIAELLQGIKNPKEEQKLSELLRGVSSLEVTTDLWIKAGQLSCSLRRKGISLPLTDFAIAILAIENTLEVFTIDKHFEQIPGLRIYKW